MRMYCTLTGLCLLWPALALAEAASPSVPDGFVVERVAAAPLVHRPMMGSFDDRGRLYVCESAGTNRPATELIADPQDEIRILTDSDGDGVFDTSTVFADRLVFPQGCLWYRGAVYTCSSPYLWKLEDTDGDDVCDTRTVLVKSFGFSGNAADIHGPFLGPDGRFYWCDGRHGHEIRDLGEGEFGGEDTVAAAPADPEPGLPNVEGSLLTKGKAARIFSCRPDGSDVQVLCGGGMDNPVEVDFFETGECLGSVNLFYDRPRGDCLVHWIEGGVYPRYDQQDSIAEFKSTGDLLTEVHNYGHVAVSGMTRYRSGRLFPEGEELTDSAEFLVTQFNTHKVVHTVLQRDGATFRHVETRDLFVSPDPDCHPTDVIEDADGSLLVIDTGGWFRIGCPTSQVAKPDVYGGIYRIRKAGTTHVPRSALMAALPSGGKADATSDDLLYDLCAAKPVMRSAIVDRMEIANEQQPGVFVAPLMNVAYASEDSSLRIDAVWARTRISPSAYLGEAETEDESAAARWIIEIQTLDLARLSEFQDDLARLVKSLSAMAKSPSYAVRRAAVTALARPDLDDLPRAAAVIESLRGQQPERMMEHAATYALIQIADRPTTAAALSDSNPQIRRAALIALDQMDGGNLQRDEVIPLLDTDDALLQKAVLDVIARHDGWAGEALALIRDWVHDPAVDVNRHAVLRGFLIARAAEPDVQQLVAESLTDRDVPLQTRLALLEVLSRAAVDPFPAAWTDPLKGTLAESNDGLRLEAIRVIAARNLDVFDTELAALAASPTEPPRVRSEAFAAIASRLPAVDDSQFEFVNGQLSDPETAVIDRLRIVTGLSAAKLSESQLFALAATVQSTSPAAVPALLRVFAQPSSERVGQALLASLSAVRSEAPLNAADVRRVLSNYPESVQVQGAVLIVEIGDDSERAAARIDELVQTIAGGDAERGRALFHGKQAACVSCHRVQGMGALVGPDLTRISAIRQPRDLLESILSPSASFARGYEAYNVLLEDGRVVSGIIARETAQDVVLRTNDLSEVRIARSAIDELQPSQTSIMPQGLEGRLTRDELRDLMAYLAALK